MQNFPSGGPVFKSHLLPVYAGNPAHIERNNPGMGYGEIYIFPSDTRSMTMRIVRAGAYDTLLNVKIADVTVRDLKQRLRGSHTGLIRLALRPQEVGLEQRQPPAWYDEYRDLQDGKRIISDYHDGLEARHQGVLFRCELEVEYL